MTHAIAARAALTPAPSPTLRRLAAVLFAAAALGFAGSAAAQDSLPEEVRETRDRDAELRIEMDNSPEIDPANRPEDPHAKKSELSKALDAEEAADRPATGREEIYRREAEHPSRDTEKLLQRANDKMDDADRQIGKQRQAWSERHRVSQEEAPAAEDRPAPLR